MQKVILIFLLVLAPLSIASESISEGFLLVQIEEYKLNNVKHTVESSNIIASWVVRKTGEIQYPFICSTLLAGYLDTEKTKRQNINRLQKMLSESEGVTKLFTDSESTVHILDSTRKKTELKIKNIDQFSYNVNCLEILPNSELQNYFNFSGEQ
ncbi:TPA: hypothetical protein RQJ98_004591 [Vibrio vulnificus]|nr:hypothetical protein [Vibrio cidicii]HAS6364014.1 hypothetical protein [Vibrio vulnificus]HDY7544677.1 hypothetical protein [Vibrio vulnificus]HDY7685931.1 hypothetical protein [Vibrio vulnificus]